MVNFLEGAAWQARTAIQMHGMARTTECVVDADRDMFDALLGAQGAVIAEALETHSPSEEQPNG